MKRLLAYTAILCFVVGAAVSFSQSQLGVRSLRGPAIWFRDGGSGNDILVDLDPKTLVLVPPGTAGGRPILRAVTTPGSVIRQKSIVVNYFGAPFALPDTPLPGTVVQLNWGALAQIPGQDFTLSGKTITFLGSGWSLGDTLVITYFY